uniref:TonB-dependent receptor n=1 Tax=Roseihalotalea indica TaxID=2867963 RepID=A0AA49GG47_9BACT|nr:TonB-dependent receptor [Tunicatimonas sp. TK19036]
MERLIFTRTLVACMAIATWSHAQELKGNVYTAQGEPVMYATVALLSIQDSSVVTGGITDEAGVYVFRDVKQQAAEHVIRVTHVGYQTTYSAPFIIPESNESVEIGDIKMSEASQALDEVLIKAQKPLIEKRPDRLIMDLNNSILSQGMTASEVLAVVPLVSTDNEGNFTVRGKPNVMIFLDGKTIPDATLSSVLSNLSAEQIEKIEVITNPSAKYDAATSGGVIEITTKRGLTQGLNGSLRQNLSQGNLTRSRSNVELNYKTQRWAIRGDLGYNFHKDVKNEFYEREFYTDNTAVVSDAIRNKISKTPMGGLSLEYAISDKHTIGVSGDFLIADNHTRETIESSLIAPSDPIMRTTTKSDWITESTIANYNIHYQGMLGDKSEVSTNITHTSFDQNYHQLVDFFVPSNANNAEQTEQNIKTDNPSNIQITIGQLDFSHSANEALTIESGLKYSHIANDSKLIQDTLTDGNWVSWYPDNHFSYVESIAAGYLTVASTLGGIDFQTGLRVEHTNADLDEVFNRQFTDFFPSVLVSKNFSDAYALSVSYSRKINRPSYEDMIPFRRVSDQFTIREGNPSLRPQYSHSLELSNTLWASTTVLLNYSLLQDAILDIPIRDEETDVMVFSFRNLAKVTNYNASVIVPVTPFPWWQSNNTISGNYSVLDDPEISREGFAEDMASFSISSTHVFLLENDWKAELLGSYSSTTQYGIYEVLPIYSISAGIGKDVLRGLGNIKVGIQDLLRSNRFRGNSDFNNTYQNIVSYSDTRRVYFSFTYNFGKQTVAKMKERSMGNDSETNRLRY